MSSSDRRERWAALLGLGATAAVSICTLWLAVTGGLGLYINPRYLVFTVALAAIAVPASVAAVVVVLTRGGAVHDHDHDATPEPQGREARGRSARVARDLGAGIAAVAVVAVTLAMLVLPPATLSARTAEQRAVNAGSLTSATGGSGDAAATLLGAGTTDTRGFGVKDWAAAIRQTTDTSALTGRTLTLTGFVVRSGSTDSFTLTRFVISCCAVDAQPVGVVVLAGSGALPDSDAWVRVTGSLVSNPDASSGDRLVVRPASITPVAQPKDPYEY